MRFSSKTLILSFVILIGLARAAIAHDVDWHAASLAGLIERVQPNVVSIQTVDHVAAGAPAAGRIGSGVIIDGARGLVVTNYHVVEQASQIYVSLSDERTFLAAPIGADAGEDLAVLRIKADALTALPLAPRGAARVGDFVIAIGNPYGLKSTVTTGIISGLNRRASGTASTSRVQRSGLIQTDAALNSGSSGGALINRAGELVGVNTSIMARSGQHTGIGFAVSAAAVRDFVAQVIETTKQGDHTSGTLRAD